jgi:molybdopterin synthase sulfur carrier subunit
VGRHDRKKIVENRPEPIVAPPSGVVRPLAAWHGASMARVYIPAQWRDLTGGTADVQLEGHSLKQIVAGLEARFPGIAARVCDDGGIVGGLAVSIDGAISSRGLLAPVEPHSEIHFLPAIGGG